VFSYLLDGSSKTNPAIILLFKIIEANLFNYWTYDESYPWFIHTVKMSVDPASRLEMIAPLDQISNRISLTKKTNNEFAELSERIKKVIDRCLRQWQDLS
jgi:hypothetical protein